MDNETVFVLLAVGIVLVAVAHELSGQVSRIVNLLGGLAALVAGIAVLVR